MINNEISCYYGNVDIIQILFILAIRPHNVFWQKDAAALAQWIINGKRKLSIVPLEYHLEVGLHWYIKCTNLYDKPV